METHNDAAIRTRRIIPHKVRHKVDRGWVVG
jgi:hypothetical protein